MPNIPGGFNNPFNTSPNSFGQRAGQGLPANLQHEMEVKFGADLSNVRVHESHAATHLNAQSYVDGNEIYFSPGSYQPATEEGQRLLSHELAHVVQQSGSGVNLGAIQESIESAASSIADFVSDL